MSAVQALKAARDAGVRIGIDGDALTLDAEAAPPAAVLDLLSHHKAGVVALLRIRSRADRGRWPDERREFAMSGGANAAEAPPADGLSPVYKNSRWL